MRRAFLIPLLIISHSAAIWSGYELLHARMDDRFSQPIPNDPVDKVLDGDTVVNDGVALHIRDIDAPELGPWAHCWAEAALAGAAKNYLETELSHGKWKATEAPMGGSTTKSVHLIRNDGEDVADLMVVGGYAARTTGHWDWCGPNASLHQVLDGEHPPHGPSLWWPSGTVFDPRAND